MPENRLRAYDMCDIIEGLCDVDSVMELRRGWGRWDPERTPADDAVQTYVSGVRRQAMYRGSETLEN